jgi:lycopene cyclase CruA
LKKPTLNYQLIQRFVRAFVQKEKVLIECENTADGKRRLFAAKLFVDSTGTNSSVSRQISAGKSITHVCPTVGTVATGFKRGSAEKEVDFSVGEILVTCEDAADNRQLIWEGFAGNPRRDEYTTYLFFYDSVESKADKSLLRLFEDYFEKLPDYKSKNGAWRVVKPVFGYIPSIHHHGWKNVKKNGNGQDFACRRRGGFIVSADILRLRFARAKFTKDDRANRNCSS